MTKQFYAEQEYRQDWWVVRRVSERSRPIICRDSVLSMQEEAWPDGGEQAAIAIADFLSQLHQSHETTPTSS